MSKNILYIKNMVCPRCIKAVELSLKKVGLTPLKIELGEAEIREDLNDIDVGMIRDVLTEEGFELIENEDGKITDRIKTEIISLIQNYNEVQLETIVFSDYLSKKISKDYFFLSNLFSKMEGITIEHYVILQKIEKAKELLKYGELNLNEISYKLGYSSVQHLSKQFKQVTGLTAT